MKISPKVAKKIQTIGLLGCLVALPASFYVGFKSSEQSTIEQKTEELTRVFNDCSLTKTNLLVTNGEKLILI